MKNIILFIFLISGIFGIAQSDETEFERLVEAEMKAAASRQAVVVNPNTLNYDITYHELRYTVDPADYFIAGTVSTTFTALANMNSITFDMANELTVTSVKKNGVAMSFSESGNNELVINFPTTIVSGTSATVEIVYSGVPPVSGFSAFAAEEHNGTPVLWTLSEPFGARDWWPCKQDLNDKIDSIDVYVTAPTQYTVASNGLQLSANDNGNGTKTTRFQHNYPIPAYLIAIAVTNYDVINQTAGTAPNDFPIVNYIYPENNTTTVQNQLLQTPLIMNLYESLFETYPFSNEKYGHAQFGWSGGMEHTTISFMQNFSRGLVAHELAHQWFGDKITCGSWKDIWLNEGFATYLASMVIENFDGNAAFVSNKNAMISNITSQTTGAVYLTEAEAEDVNRIFSSRLSYNKGAMVLNMLRFKMGDALFFQALKNYLADEDLAYGYAVTGDLKLHLEAVYGNLDEFFNDWVYGQGYPTYTLNAQNWGAGQAKIIVNQTQSNSSVAFFEMPLEIRFSGAGGVTHDVIVNNTSNGQEFIVAVPFVVTGVTFDPNKEIISKNNVVTLANETFDLAQTISVYPNPATDELHIMMPTTLTLENIEIYNTLGQLIGEKNTLDFSISALSSGLHFLKISTSEGIIHKNFIKK